MTRVQPNRLRICIFSREYPPDTGWGGIGTFSYHLAHGLVELGHDVEVISIANKRAGETEQNGIRIHRVESLLKDEQLGMVGRAIPHSNFVINSTPAMWKKFSELHRERPFDVIDSPELLAEGIFPALSKFAPLVIRLYTPHSKFIAEQFHNVCASFDHLLIAMAERLAMRHADVITSPSQDLAQYVAQDIGYPIEQIALVPNPIDPAEFCPDGLRAIDKPEQLKVLFVGRLEQRKGIYPLVRAIPQIVAAIPNVHFYIIGDDTNTAKGRKSVLRQLKRFIAEANCRANTTFINRVPLKDLPTYYRSADICIVPSLYDNSPYTCLEAMACGQAVIGTTAGGTREYLNGGESGVLIPPNDHEAIVQAVVALLRNKDERARLGKNARERVVQKYKRTEIARQMVELYRQAVVKFEDRKRRPLYAKGPERVVSDLNGFVHSFNLMLHQVAFRESFRYRLASTLNLIRRRPKLFFAAAALKGFRSVLPGNTVCKLQLVRWLERQIHVKGECLLSENAYGVTVIPIANLPVER